MILLMDYLKGRDNNFNLIRLIAAILVIYSHSKVLSGNGADPLIFAQESFGLFAVNIFFILSGFLVTKSALSRNSLPEFVFARVLRIYPGLIMAVLFCAFVVGPIFTSWPRSEYFEHWVVYDFIKNNIRLLPMSVRHYLPGVFENNFHRGIVNGSLWTLPFELWAYISLTVLYLGCVFKKRQIIACLFALLWIIYSSNHYFHFITNLLYVLGLSFFTFFFAGVFFYIFRDKIPFSKPKALILLFFTIGIPWVSENMLYIIYPFILPYLTFAAAFLISGTIRSFNKLGDYSYGIYIYAFPIQQSIVALIGQLSHIQMFVLSVAFTFPFAYISWKFVEEPSLSIKEKYMKRACGRGARLFGFKEK